MTTTDPTITPTPTRPGAEPDATPDPPTRLPGARYLRAFRTPRGMIAATLIALLVGVSVLAPVLFPGGYDEQTPNALLPVSWAHPFGTDELGRDIFARSIYGLRTDLALVAIAVPIGMAVGTILGLLGAIVGWLGTFVQRMLDIIVGFPSLILGISVVLVIGTGFWGLVISIILIGLPTFGRLARQVLLTQQNREYVLAARTLGIGRGRIMVRHILPNTLDPILVQGSVFIVQAVFLEAGLSIVGLGIQPPEPSLGSLLNMGMRYVEQAPTYIIGPIVVLLLLALAFSLLTDALNEAVNR